ncbi:MAG TPA: hypothetical protein VM493_13060, partial [Vicinamibacterales bacterium]|nr:hypothetical protein [Vicinamibacterales bacterium]
MKLTTVIFAIAALAAATPALAWAPKEKSDFERATESAGDKVRAESRGGKVADTTHEGRIKVDKDVSVGGALEKGGATANVRTS